MSRIPLRWRLAGAFTVATTIVLAVLGLFLHERLRAELDASLRSALEQRAGDLVAVARRQEASDLGTGGLVEPGDDMAQIVDPATNHVVSGAPGFGSTSLLTRDEATAANRQPVRVAVRRVGDEDEPASLLAAPAGTRVVVVGASLEDRNDALDKLDNLLVLGLPIALLISAAAGFVVAGRGLAPIDRIRVRAQRIEADDLARRVPEPAANDELRRLAQTLNALLARLETAFRRERTFVADAGHELRTPLSALKSELELARRPGRSEAELRAALDSAAEETERLIRLAEDLLTVARMESGELPIRPAPLDVRELLERVAGRQPAAIAVASPDELTLTADPLRMEQALGNLLDNAQRHGSEPISMTAEPQPSGSLRITVRDHGPGLAPGLGDRAFERFTRGDAARDGEGAGLGLAIVAAITGSHGGAAGLGSAEGGGCEVWIELPASALRAATDEPTIR
ncbi:MAG TPA: ATP-binding protein [Solirubrobacteraceae bacterium]|jgi:signal transduction histidine kinase|nr:ATP-binding protein [Solirubrobacteraceae bacterium]